MSASDLLVSWNDTPTRRAIVDFVDAVTSPGEAYVPPEQRVATFDKDGTLCSEKPMPIQLDYTLRRLEKLADSDESLRDRQPWKACYEHDFEWLGEAMVKHYHGDDSDMRLLMAAVPTAFAGLTVEQYADEVATYF
jgi:hypothetical protein